MKTFLWLAAAASAVAATAAALYSYKRSLPAPRLALAEVPLVIEMVPLETSGPVYLDPVTERLLEELADHALFLD